MSANSVLPPVRGQQRIFCRYGAERAVRVPELVAEVEHPPPVVARKKRVVLADVGNISHFDRQPPVLRPGDIAADRTLDLTEIAAEGELLLIRDVLVVEGEHRVFVHAGLDRCDLIARQWLPEVDARDLADEDRMDLANTDGHLRPPMS